MCLWPSALYVRAPKGICDIFLWQEHAHKQAGKDLAPYRIGKHSNPQNSPTIHQKYSKKYDFRYFWGYFFPILLVGAFSYSVGGQVFRNTSRPPTDDTHCSACAPFPKDTTVLEYGEQKFTTARERERERGERERETRATAIAKRYG